MYTLAYTKNVSVLIKVQFFSLCTDLFSVLCIQTLRKSLCELCSVRYVRVCLHVHKNFKRNEQFCSHCSEGF